MTGHELEVLQLEDSISLSEAQLHLVRDSVMPLRFQKVARGKGYSGILFFLPSLKGRLTNPTVLWVLK
jgi:hypothetical protein